MAELYSYLIPNLIQGISQQPDAQRDPSQAETQINAVSSVQEGLRKRDGSRCLAKVNSTPLGDCFIHSILRDQAEKYLAVITSSSIRVFDLSGNELTVVAPLGYGYLSSVTSARKQIRATTIADYTFVINTAKVVATDPALAPSPSRPSPNEALIWVKAANYGQTYKVNVNNTQVEVQTAVAALTSSGNTQVENRISTESIAETIKLGLEGKLTGVATITPNVPTALAISKPAAITAITTNVFLGTIASITKLSGTGIRGQNGATYSNLSTTTNALGFGATVSVTLNTQGETLKSINTVTLQNAGNGYKPGDLLAINAFAISGNANDPTSLNVASVASVTSRNKTNVPTTSSGLGRGMTVDIAINGQGLVTSCVINQPGIGYALNDTIYVQPFDIIPNSTQPKVAVGTVTQMADQTATGAIFTNIPTSSTTGTGCTVDLTIKNGQITAVALNQAGNGYVVGNALKINPTDVDSTSTSTTQITVATVATVLPLVGGINGVTVTRSGSVLWLQSQAPITVSAIDARANADITAIFDEVQAFTELPTIAPTGYQVAITGDPGTKFDGYYVSFKPRTGSFGEGSWIETVSPGVEYRLDAITMPHVLIRLANGTFLFAPANGSQQSGITLPKWGERTAGDYDTAPDPSFVGQTINDIFVFKNRLGVLADENVILSRSREFFEFFPETVSTVLDTDPIDLSASNNRVAVLRYAVPYQDELILFSDQYQFRYNSADTALTPSTAQITVLTQFEVDPNVRPQQAGGSILFVQANGEWSQIRDFSVRGNGTSIVGDAQDLTANASSYIPAEVFKMTVNDTSNAAFIISGKTGFENRIYVYKYFFRNTGAGAERAQSSWSYWQFNGATKVLQVVCILEMIYLLVQYSDGVYLEVIPAMDRASVDANGAPVLAMDRLISTTTATPSALRVASGTYNANTNTTTWTLPFSAQAEMQAWSTFAPGQSGGVWLATIAAGSATATARGNWSGKEVWFGETFTFRYRFSRFKTMAEIGGGKAASNALRTQVRKAMLRFHETGYFEALVTAQSRATVSYTMNRIEIATRQSAIGGSAIPADPDAETYASGVFEIPILSRGDQAVVELRNASPHPCKFSTCEWTGLITGKARPMR